MTVRLYLLSLLFVVSSALSLPDETLAAGKPVVYASNYPLYFFASEIAGDELDIRFPEIDGDPAFWVPDGEQAAALQAADLVLLNGAGYEGWLDFVTLRDSRLVDTTAHLADHLLPIEEATVHQHGPEGEHSHAETAFTTWLDPQLAEGQAEAVAKALARLAPAGEARFMERLDGLKNELVQLDSDLQQSLSGLDGRPVVFSHPVYQYLQARYQINGRSVHWEPEVVPGTRDWIAFQKLLANHPARLLIWEGMPAGETLARLEEQGIGSLVFETAGSRPDQGDFFDAMERNRRRLMKLAAYP